MENKTSSFDGITFYYLDYTITYQIRREK